MRLRGIPTSAEHGSPPLRDGNRRPILPRGGRPYRQQTTRLPSAFGTRRTLPGFALRCRSRHTARVRHLAAFRRCGRPDLLDEWSWHASGHPASGTSAPSHAGAARSRGQDAASGQRCRRHSSHVANPAGGSSIGSVPSSSPGVGMSMLAAHSASSSSDIGHVVCGASAWR